MPERACLKPPINGWRLEICVCDSRLWSVYTELGRESSEMVACGPHSQQHYRNEYFYHHNWKTVSWTKILDYFPYLHNTLYKGSMQIAWPANLACDGLEKLTQLPSLRFIAKLWKDIPSPLGISTKNENSFKVQH